MKIGDLIRHRDVRKWIGLVVTVHPRGPGSHLNKRARVLWADGKLTNTPFPLLKVIEL